MRRSPKRRRVARRIDFLPASEVAENRVLLSIVPRGAPTQVDTSTTGGETSPAVAMDANGDSIVVWVDNDQDLPADNYEAAIRAQRYSPTGSPVHQNGTTAGTGQFTVEAAADSKDIERESPSVAMDPSGDFVVVWKLDNTTVTGAYTYEIQARVFNSSGVAQTGDITVSHNDGKLRSQPSVTMDSSGNFVVAWADQENRTPGNNDIYAKKFSLSGTPIAARTAPRPVRGSRSTPAPRRPLTSFRRRCRRTRRGTSSSPGRASTPPPVSARKRSRSSSIPRACRRGG